LIILIAALYIY